MNQRSIFIDWTANHGSPKIQVALMLFRLAVAVRGDRSRRRPPLSIPVGTVYRLLVEWTWGIELPWRLRVGAPIMIYHGFGVVVNEETKIGDRVTLRQGVTIGNLQGGGPCPVIEDDVEVGVGAVIIGGVTIGKGARIGANAVVLRDVPAGATAVGVPARILNRD